MSHKILIIDDQPENVFVLQDRLEHEGYNVIIAYDGQSGINKAVDEQPDIILLDIMMPGMSGFEVCEVLTKNEKTKKIPIIMVTALTGSDDIKKGLELGAYDYIKKPFNRVELLARIKSALRFKETQNLLLEVEKINVFSATVQTANHKIKQPLTLINLSVAALRRELGKENISKEQLLKRVDFLEIAAKEIVEVLEQLTSIKKPVIKEYVNNLKMIDVKENENDSAD